MSNIVYTDSDNGLIAEQLEASIQPELQYVVDNIKSRHDLLNGNSVYTQDVNKLIGEVVRYWKLDRYKMYRVSNDTKQTELCYSLIEEPMWIRIISPESSIESLKTILRYTKNRTDTIPDVILAHTADTEPHEYQDIGRSITSDVQKNFIKNHTVYQISESKI